MVREPLDVEQMETKVRTVWGWCLEVVSLGSDVWIRYGRSNTFCGFKMLETMLAISMFSVFYLRLRFRIMFCG